MESNQQPGFRITGLVNYLAFMLFKVQRKHFDVFIRVGMPWSSFTAIHAIESFNPWMHGYSYCIDGTIYVYFSGYDEHYFKQPL